MFTPIGFYAAAGAAFPQSVVDNADVFYSADQNTDWTDLSGNGNDGTVSAIGSGGTSAITHVAGAQPYWHFTCPSPSSEQPYLDTGYVVGSPGGTYTMFTIIKFDDLSTNFQGIMLMDDIPGNANQLLTFNQNTTPIFFAFDRGTSSGDNKTLIPSTTAPSTTDWIMLTMVADGANGITWYINNVSEATAGQSTAGSFNQSLRIGRTYSIINNYENKGKIAASGFFNGYALDASERTELYDYYDAIYSF